MFTVKHYVPVLVWKTGEQQALGEVESSKREYITPLIEVPPIPYDWVNECPAKSIDNHLAGLVDSIGEYWDEGRPAFLDMTYIADEERMPSGQHPLDFILDEANSQNVPLIPVTDFERDADYQAAVKSAIVRDGLGVCFRITSDMARMNLKKNIDDLITLIGAKTNEVDIILDFGSIPSGTESMTEIAAGVILPMLPYLIDWRSLTLLGSGFPQNLGGFGANTISTTPRTEWIVWNNLVSSTVLPRNPSFGDYTISHPILSELDPRIIKPSASVRYTSTSEWYIFKGQQLKKHGFGQYPKICKIIVSHAVYSKPPFSWGDGYINDCQLGTVGTGNLTTWRQVAVSHHLTFVSHQISTHPAV